ncbi:hypothetical protein DVH26_07635 [Paenibacillus sp. H1-7]|uniref:hypothetical protein n=1 Tax=Paenibacillus sp. H1-7 TaxID=2282849 RepID=UPI001EF7F294|nr:hypothetical protein [Paenibacillus sp. H1-7]ULL14329.1 hypothetical protein DVH26_07635 [Paenibacillus sp. H1-7]
MKANAAKTEKEMFAWLATQVSILRYRPKNRVYLRQLIAKVRAYKNDPHRAELLQKYADFIEPHRSNPNFHSASFAGFFHVIGGESA